MAWSSCSAAFGDDPLADARGPGGSSPRSWLDQSLGGVGEPVIGIRPGTMLTVGSLGAVVAGHWSLPLRSNSVAAVALDMCLPALPRVGELFAELRRVLRPAGTVAALVPLRPGWRDSGWRPVERAAGGRPEFRNESARDHLHWLVAAADFAVLTDRRRTFRLPIPDRSAARTAVDALVDGGYWPPDLEPTRLDAARRALAEQAGPGRTLPLRLRLLVVRR